MLNLSNWDIALYGIATYLAIVFLVRLMRIHRNKLLAELRSEFDQVVQQKIMERASQEASDVQVTQISKAAEMAKVVRKVSDEASAAAAVERMKQAVAASSGKEK